MGTADIVSHGITFGVDAGLSVEVEHVMAGVLFLGNKAIRMNPRGCRVFLTSEAE
jgi:hypothetical protein